MSSATVQVLRSVTTSGIGAKYHHKSPQASIYVPRDPLVTTPHLSEHLNIAPVSGLLIPGGTPVFELPYEVDLVQKINLIIRLDRVVLNGTATFARPVDFYGLAVIDELLFRFGTERLQVVRALEIMAKIHWLFEDEERNQAREMLRGGLTPLQRTNQSTAGPTLYIIPLYTLLGVHLGGDPSQTLGVRMMAERFRLECRMSAVNTLMESDGTYSFQTAAVVGQPPPAAGHWLAPDSSMYVEGKHIIDSERRMMEEIYRAPRRYFFRDYQHATPVRVLGTQGLNTGTTVDIPLREINQPVVGLQVHLRWAADLDRVEGGAGGTRGRNRFNYGGWFNPGGAITNAGLPIVAFVEGRVGSNAFFLRQTRVEILIRYEKARAYKGSGVENGSVAIIHFAFSHDASRENAQLGFIDFSQLDNPVLRLTFNTDSGHATINAAATADIGQNSDLDIQVVADTFNQLNFAKSVTGRPYN